MIWVLGTIAVVNIIVGIKICLQYKKYKSINEEDSLEDE